MTYLTPVMLRLSAGSFEIVCTPSYGVLTVVARLAEYGQQVNVSVAVTSFGLSTASA